MNTMNLKTSGGHVLLWFVMTIVCSTLTAHAAQSTYRVAGKVMLSGQTDDSPVEGARVSAVKFSSDLPSEVVADTTTTAVDGSFALDIPVDSGLGAFDLFNKAQIRVEGSESTDADYGVFVTSCSPVMELLNFTQPGPPLGDIEELEIAPILRTYADEQFAAISAIENEDDVDPTKGILLVSVEYADGDEIEGISGVHFKINGTDTATARFMYMDADRTWNRQLDRTTSAGIVMIYNIPLDAVQGWQDIGLEYDLVNAANDYILGVYPWVRVYSYQATGRISVASYQAEKRVYAENDDPGPDDGGGGGGGCFIAIAGI
ncbi:MAG TPA: hypothetical protein PLB81_04955 [Deltaproteobacteria bacterium]|nr:hypothetical protein [Deltaproteobacteria bacterium]